MLTMDKGKAVFISTELDAIRTAAKEELKRYDVTPAVRRQVHILEDALDLVINTLGGKRPNRQAKEIGLDLEYPLYSQDEQGTKQLCIPVVGEDVVVFTPAPEGSEEMIAERKREVAARKEAVRRGEYQRKVGNTPNYRVEGQ